MTLARRFGLALLGLAASVVALAAAALLSGQFSAVSTHGVSMNPVYYQGDLVIVQRAPAYSVGEIVAYRVPGSGTVVLHRIIGGNAESGFIIKGDNNQSTDVVKPTPQQILGHAVLHIPHGGAVLNTITSPWVLALVAFALVAGGGTGAMTRRRRRRARRSTAVSRHLTSPKTGLWHIPRASLAAGGLAAILLVGGAAAAATAWTPVAQPATPGALQGAVMQFSYSAAVGRTPAYDGPTASSPDPIFRKVANTVEVRMDYSGQPGTIAVTAELSNSGGWHTTLPLSAPAQFSGTRHESTVALDLDTLDARAQAGAAATGTPANPVEVTLTAVIHRTSGEDFAPALKLRLTPQQLALDGDAKALTATAPTASQPSPGQSDTVSLLGMRLPVGTARIAVVAALLAGVAAAAVAFLLGRPSARPADPDEAIRRRYGPLLVRVHPLTSPPGRAIVDVTSFLTLAKLAERYGLLVLHWTRAGVTTYVVQDEAITYRYRGCVPDPGRFGEGSTAAPNPDAAGEPDATREKEIMTELGDPSEDPRPMGGAASTQRMASPAQDAGVRPGDQL
ncbi:signal peptidase I [Sinomonas susongensis]|uniref:signal peptidase I n=1 Tax=Sinomonas susongensis TaxID=1324851 RepID=UPI001108693D|nr:signal peptidase I [Sinomonas susongensis]